MGGRNPVHTCIVIVAQDTWEDSDRSKVTNETLAGFLASSEHGDCHICLTCPVCKATWDLFDPSNPGEYNTLCEICKPLLAFLEAHTGQNEKIIYFSHATLEKQKKADFIFRMLDSFRVKKMFYLETESPTIFREEKFFSAIKFEIAKKLDIIGAIQVGIFKQSVLYEIRKDYYY